jgi:hypothetical protein
MILPKLPHKNCRRILQAQALGIFLRMSVQRARVASALGKAIGQPDLKWVEFTDEQALQGMQQAGLPTEIANNYVEMGTA